MNKAIIWYILGWVLKLEGLFMILPCIVAVVYGESTGWYFVFVAIACFLGGSLLSFKKPKNTVFYMREGCIATALSWIVISLVGCLPFYFSGEIPQFIDALFETVSGFTTTGASVLSDIEALSYCMLFWRSFTHWIGGMGVLVFLLAIIQMTGGSHMNLMRAESPGPSVGKLVPRVMHTARILYVIYICMTVLLVVLLLAGGMTPFDALTSAFSTAGTGGFSVKNTSIMEYSPYIQWVITIFMILFGVNFNAYYMILLRKWKQIRHMEEIWHYFLIIGTSITIIMIDVYERAGFFFENLRHSAFQVASVITTTGMMTVDFDRWPTTSKCILLFLMFIGACAGSTGGGMKVTRFILAIKTIFREVNSYVFPKSIKRIKMGGNPVEEESIRGITVYFIAYITILVVSTLLVSLERKGLVTTFTAVVGTLNNVGPGLDMVGPTKNFGIFSIGTKLVLMFDMLAGRLELFPLLILIYPPSWKAVFKRTKKS